MSKLISEIFKKTFKAPNMARVTDLQRKHTRRYYFFQSCSESIRLNHIQYYIF